MLQFFLLSKTHQTLRIPYCYCGFGFYFHGGFVIENEVYFVVSLGAPVVRPFPSVMVTASLDFLEEKTLESPPV